MKNSKSESRKPKEIRGGMTEASPGRSRTVSRLHCSNLNGQLLVLLALLATLVPCGAQYTLDWWTINGGGGTSAGGVLTVSGTIGQPDAGVMSGGDYSLTGGFWALCAVPTVGPALSIQLTGNTVMVYWPSPSPGFHLEVNTDLSTANWVTPAENVQDNGTIKYILVSPPWGDRFYRLKKP